MSNRYARTSSGKRMSIGMRRRHGVRMGMTLSVARTSRGMSMSIARTCSGVGMSRGRQAMLCQCGQASDGRGVRGADRSH